MLTIHRIAHLSDIHLAPGARGAEPRRLFEWAVADLEARVAAGLALDAIVLNGDIYDGASTPAERNLLAELVQRLARLAPVAVVKGNHDRPGDLDFLTRLAAPFPIAVYSEPAVHRLDTGLTLAVLPWLDRAMPADDARTYSVEDAAAREQAALATILDKLGADVAAVWPRRPVVFCGHLMLDRAVPGLGQPTKRGRDFVLTLADLARVPAAAYLLGHVHTAQRWQIGAAPVAYNGSLHRSAFGEVEAKGYTILTLDGEGMAELEAIETPATPMVLLANHWQPYDPEGDRPAAWAHYIDTRGLDGADVRFRYTVPHVERAAARRAAAAVKLTLEGAGARRVELDPQVTAPVRQKLPAFTAAQGLGDKLACWLTRERIDHDAPKSRLARAFLADLERALGTVRGGVAAGGMRLHRLTVGGVGPFVTPVTLDLDAMPGEVVAIRGRNGAGKSTLLGCWPAAMFGRMPDKRRLAALETSDSAIVHAEVSGPGGARWLLEQQVSRSKAFVRRAGAEKPDDDSGGLKRFEAWADEHLVPSAVLLNSTFAPQKSGGLIAMAPGQRKSVLLAAMGCDHYEQMAKTCRDRAAERKATLATLAGRIAAEEERAAKLPPDPGAAIAAARSAHARASQALRDGEAADERRRAYEAATGRREAAEHGLATARAALAAIERQAAEHDALLGQASAIERAAAEHADLTARLSGMEAAHRAADEEGVRLEADRDRVAQKRDEHREMREDARQIAARAREAIAAALAIPFATPGGIAELTVDIEQSDREYTGLTARLDAIRAQRTAGLVDRIERLRAGLSDVLAASNIEEAKWDAGTTLRGDDEIAAGCPDAEEQISTLTRNIAAASARGRALEAQHAAATRALADRERAEGDLAEAMTALAAAEDGERAAAADLAGIDARLLALRNAATERGEAMARLRDDLAALDPLASQAAALDRAEASRDALAVPLAAARARVADAQAAVDVLPPVSSKPPPRAGAPVDDLRRAVEKAAADFAVAERNAADAEALATSIAVLRAERATTSLDRDAWELLAEALGRNGIQAMEIDSAGPDLTARINGLLHEHFGTRWTVTIDTTRTNDDGDVIDGLPILVYDTENGREADASTYSPGEQTILGCALAGALAGYVCARTGAEGPTVVLDESGAAVSEENTEPYVAMVRQVAAEIGASKVLLVTHSPEVVALCDAVVTVADGALTIVRAGG